MYESINKMGDATALSSRFEYIELQCDSLGANTSGGTTTLSSNWPRLFFSNYRFQPAGLKVLQAEIPFVFDTISSSNNKFYVDYGGGNVLVSVTPGTYNAEELRVELQARLNAIVAGWTVTWNAVTYKYTFNYTGPFSFTIADSTSPDINMGFSVGTFSSTANALTSTIAASPTGPFYLYINSLTLGPSVSCNVQDGRPQVQQICRVPINVQKGNVIFYNDLNPNQFFDFLPGIGFNSFDLYLTLGYDQAQVPLDLKGLGFSVKLGILNYRAGGVQISAQPATGRGGSSFYVP